MSLRATLEQEARKSAIEVLQTRRPSRTPEGGFWGVPCSECGEERPAYDVYGLICRCERDAAREMVAAFMEECRPGVAAKILERAQIPCRYSGCSFQGFEARQGTEAALAAAWEWAEGMTPDTRGGLFLAGGFGSGKTHLVTAALKVAVKRLLVDAHFISAGGLVAEVRSGTPVVRTPVERAIGAELLILDDFGQEVGTDFARDVVARVIYGRYEAVRPTLITSNLGPQALGKAVGGAVVSRIQEMTEMVSLAATDYRQRRAS
jgi:DNA replication protein DnaC